MDDLILIDWFSFTSRVLTVGRIQELLGLDGQMWESGSGAHGFKYSIYFHSIKIFVKHEYQLREYGEKSDGNDDTLVWLDMSGQGCRAYETFGKGDWNGLFAFCLGRSDINVTRVDLAFDDHSGLLDIAELKEHVDQHYFVSKFRRGIVEYMWDRLKARSYKAYTLYFGSARSEIMIRIYDKAKERNKDDEHWIRVETQFRRGNAAGVLRAMSERPVGEVYRGVLAEYLRFVTPSPDSNLRRWPTLPSWDKLLAGVGAIKVYQKPGVDYNLARLSHYSIDMAGGATYTLIRAIGITAFLDLLQNSISSRPLNPNYKQLLADLDVSPADFSEWEKEVAALRAKTARAQDLESVLNSALRALDLREHNLSEREKAVSDAQLLVDSWLPLAQSLASDEEGGDA